ncbi:hypothetical protein DVU_3129 [Nitratidesulfovibrio vulgaris str. Hildenborough]|uniref:Uncharacterized protein n=1 Tax=Nitratidesulfovibrio vulgaris (strain ATCC 29579 / DSM 644 / CCUG 34227 / NCIMB 8303 / VKM B-1760 / Hildenborough) TaxID=882 RepID=Q726H9_NITV2|nr:hypothetical protein DVU_3129 [Nitratidesulfovibrio vulgaris str. Hildenborough]
MPRHRNVVATSNVFLLAGGMAYAMPRRTFASCLPTPDCPRRGAHPMPIPPPASLP